ncbi:hypothetical protein N7475_000328 [Penicillium sp. IBT 31633x]|nr:hypothetical protein N7475_000328 [Penicillium sp. IBT 31633x]
MRRRIIHFYYAALTMKSLPDHFDAIRNENYMLRAKLFHHIQAPWEGDSVSLKSSRIGLYRWIEEHKRDLLSVQFNFLGKRCRNVLDDDELKRCRAIIQSIKDGLMEHSSTEMEKIAVLSHFPFDDHEENA